jgi:hypothetical protein
MVKPENRGRGLHPSLWEVAVTLNNNNRRINKNRKRGFLSADFSGKELSHLKNRPT